MSSILLFTYSDIPINDVVQLNFHLASSLGTSFKYVNYVPATLKLVVAAIVDAYLTTEALEQAITDSLYSFSNPPAPNTRGNIQTGNVIKSNILAPYSGSSIAVQSILDLTNNKIINVDNPTLPNDVSNKAYVDALSAGLGLTKDTNGPTFNVNVDNTLYIDPGNQIGIASSALSTGLTGGNGVAISVVPNQSQIVTVGTLNSLNVAGMITAQSGLSAENNLISNVATPVDLTDASNKSYVDSTIRLSAGNGLSAVETLLSVNVDNTSLQITNDALHVHPNWIGYGLTGGQTLSVNANQPNIVSLGTLTSLTVSGNVLFTSTADSMGVTSGAVQLSGGLGVAKNINVAGNVYIGNGLNMNAKNITNLQDPVNANDATNKAYVDSVITTPGFGLVKSGTSLSVNVDAASIEVTSENVVRLASGALGTGLSGGSGNVVSVISNQSQVTQVGTLVSLSVSGDASLDSTNDSIGATSGSLRVAGGAYVGKSLRVAGNTFFSGVTNFTSTVHVHDTVDSTDINTGAVQIHGGISVSKSIHVGGIVNVNNQKIINLASPVNPNDAGNKAYIDSLVVTAGNGLEKTGTVIRAVVDNSSLEIFNNSLRVSSSFVGTGLSGGSGSPLQVNAHQPQITSLGTLSSLGVNGIITAYSGINANNARISYLGAPLNANDAATKNYVDTTRPTPGSGLVAAATGTALNVNVDNASLQVDPVGNVVQIASTAVGTGLTGGSGSVISVVPEQPQIVTVGTLNILSVAGQVNFNSTNDSTSAVSGPVVVRGGLSVNKSLHVGGTLNALNDLIVTADSTFLGTSVYSGILTSVNTNDSIDASTGSLVTAGGIGVGKTLFAAGGVSLTNNYKIKGSSGSSGESNILDLHGSNTTDSSINFFLSNVSALGSYANQLRLYSLGKYQNVDTEFLSLTTDSTGGYLQMDASGIGAVRDLVLNRYLKVGATGLVTCSSTQNSTSTTQAALVVSNGGLGVVGSSHFGETIFALSGIDTNGSRITNVGDPISPYDAANMRYVDSVAQGLSVKKSVIAASVEPVLLGDIIPGYTMDGIVLAAGNRVLLKNQTNAVENGIYVVSESSTTSPSRSPDLDDGSNASAAFVFVESGTKNAASGWVNTTPGATDIVGTDPMFFSQFSGAGQITAGIGLSKDGNILNVNVDGSSLEILDDIVRIASGAVGIGLSGGSGSAISVNADLPHVTGLGTVTLGTWNANIVSVQYGGTGVNTIPLNTVLIGNGTNPVNSDADFTYSDSRLNVPNIIVTSSTISSSFSTGALVVKGGVGIQGNMNVNGNSLFTGAVKVPNPVDASDAVTKGYVDNNITTPGTGLSKLGTLMSVNSTLPHVTALGTLSGINIDGMVYISNTTNSINPTSGSFQSLGGIGISGNAHIGGDLVVQGMSIFNGVTIVPIPTEATHVATKSYVDSLISVPGTGLSKTVNTFSINPDLSHVTSVGVLTGLSVSGPVSFTSTTPSMDTTTGALVVRGGVGIGGAVKINGMLDTYSNVTTTGKLRIINSTPCINSATGSIVTNGGVGIGGDVHVDGIMHIDGIVESTSPITGTLVVVGGTGIQGNLTVGGKITIRDPTVDDDATTKAYVDRNLTTAGTGLTKSGTALHVDSALPHVTNVGTLSNLTVSGITQITNTTQSLSTVTGALIVNGGVGISKDFFLAGKFETDGRIIIKSTDLNALQVDGGIAIMGSVNVDTNMVVNGNSTLNGFVTITKSPTDGTHAVNKNYTDSLSYLAMGTGITKTGNVLSINSVQSQITDLGTLNGLRSIGVVTIDNTTNSTSPLSGSMTVAGGLGVSGSTFIGGSLSVNGVATFNGNVDVLTPTMDMNPVTKQYTDSLSYLSAGTGLSKVGNVISVNSIQTHIVQVGTLTSLTVSGPVVMNDTTASTDSMSGSLIVKGGIGVQDSVNIAGNIRINGNSVLVGNVTVPSPTDPSHAVNKGYTDGLSYLTAGTGLSLTGNILSVNANLPHVTTTGVLTGLESSGIVKISNTTNSALATNGALVVSGGIGVGGTSTFSSTVTLQFSPVNGNDAVNKTYTDSLSYLNTGTGLIKTGTTVSVTPALNHVTDVGTLNSLTVSGPATFNGIVHVPNPTEPTHAVNKDYADSLIQGLSIKNSVVAATTDPVTLTSVVAGSIIDDIILSVGDRIIIKNQIDLIENGIYIVGNTEPPSRSADMDIGASASGTFAFVESGTKNSSVGFVVRRSHTGNIVGTDPLEWVIFSAAGQITAGDGMGKVGNDLHVITDNISLEIFNDSLRISSGALGSGLSGGSGQVISLNADQPGIRSLGVLSKLDVSGHSSMNTITASGTVTVPSPINLTDAVNKGYTDGLTYLLMGAGISKTGSTLSINSSQPQITSVGTLSSLTSSGIVQITNTTASISVGTGALIVAGGVGINGGLNIGSNLIVNGTCNFIGKVSVPTPVDSSDATTKSYTDSISYITAGTGLSKTGSTLSVTENQSQITTLGTLTGLSSNGVVSIRNTSVSTSTVTGALQVSGGAGFQGSVFIGNGLNVVGTVTVPSPINSTDAVNRAYTDGITYISVSGGLIKTGSTLSLAASQPGITSLGVLTGLSSSGIVSITNTTVSTTTTNGALTVSGGCGIAGKLHVGDTLVANSGINYGTQYTTFVATNTALQTTIYRMRSLDSSNPNIICSVANSTSLVNYSTRFSLFNFGSPESSTNTESLVLESTGSGGLLNWAVTGTGSARPLTVYNNTVFRTNGSVSNTSTFDSVSSSTGSIFTDGGIGVAKSVHIGTNLYLGSTNIVMFSESGTGFRGVRIRNADSTNTETRINVANTNATTAYTSRLTLFSLGNSDALNQESLTIVSSGTGANLSWVTSGTGIARPLNIYNDALVISAGASSVSIGASSSFLINNTIDSTSTTTGSIRTGGGLAVAKNITSGSAIIGNISLIPFMTSGAWINIPTTASSGIGSGGAGTDCWIGYTGVAGTWFSNSAVGDICYRNTNGRLLFGNTSGLASICISGDNLGVGTVTPTAKLDVVGNIRVTGTLNNTNTTDSIDSTTGAITTAGGIGARKIISAGSGIRLMGASSGNLLITASPTTTSYTFVMPPTLPTAGTSLLSSDASGNLSFVARSPVSVVNDGTATLNNVRVYTVTVTTSGGNAVCYPTSDGTTTGNALFTTILTATASASVNTTSAISVALCGLRSISTDRKTVTFSVVTGVYVPWTSSSNTLQFAPNEISVQITIFGI